jgi:hypothetical protein
VVQNVSAQSATLSAWASCGSSDDAFLALYKRDTVPTTQAQIEACTGSIAEGASGTGGFDSLDPTASGYCPGLTKTNGQGLSLAVCGRAVVFIQAWTATSTIYPPPSTLKFKLE